VQAVPCGPACGGSEKSSTRDDHHASSIQLDKTKHSVRGFDVSQARLADLATGRDDHSGRGVDFFPPGLAKKQDLFPANLGNSGFEKSQRGRRPSPPPAVPEPAALLLFGVGLLVLQGFRPGRRA
jgi:hypothetical protein